MKYNKIELVAATVLFLLYLYLAVTQGFSSRGDDIGAGLTGSGYFFGYLLPNLSLVIATYAAFLTLNYYVLPRFWFQKKQVAAMALTALVLIITGMVFMVAQSYLRAWIYKTYGNAYLANMQLFSRGYSMAALFLIIYLLYVVVREVLLSQYQKHLTQPGLRPRIQRELILTFGCWAAALLLLIAFRPVDFLQDWGTFLFFALPYCFGIHFFNLYLLIPNYKNGGRHKALVYLLKLAAIVILLGWLEMAFLLQTHEFSFLGYLVIFWLGPTAVTIAVSWWVYWANEDNYKQLRQLQTQLGNTNANLQFLRSQINPHFLFNALNTLYGTALLEKAEKTGEGIQKLGDMMRFMLHENNLDKIALSRELDYLHNYIDLQNMRIAASPQVVIDIQMEDIVGYYEIAPMLLIPFIENAFKHGISLQEKSWINVNLYKKEHVLHLDVHNSIHPTNANDPEREHSGTGLENVKQRLQLIYPNRHNLVIRQNAREFFIHLSITLNTQNPASSL